VAFVDSWDERLRSIAKQLDSAIDHELDLIDRAGNYFIEALVTHSRFDERTSEFVIEIEMVREPPTSLGLIVRDCIQTVHSALDRLVWELVIHRGIEKPGRHTRFPVALNPQQFAQQALSTPPKSGKIRKGQLHGLLTEDIEAIRSFQPYKSLGRTLSNGFLVPPATHPLSPLAQIPKDYQRSVVHIPSITFTQPHIYKHVGSTEDILAWNSDAGIVKRVDYLYPRLTPGYRFPVVRALLSQVGPNPHVELRAPIATILFTESELQPSHLAQMQRAATDIFEALTPLFSQ
jgi:hypothetical protein